MDQNHGGHQSVDSLQEEKEEEAGGRAEGENCQGEEEKPVEKIRLQAQVLITTIKYSMTMSKTSSPKTSSPNVFVDFLSP